MALPAERAKVATFVDSIYVAAYASSPPRADAYAVIRRQGEIVGCMGLEWQRTEGRLPMERLYGLELGKLPWPMDNAVQFGRWASKGPSAGTLAVYAAVVFALDRGCVVGLVEHDESSAS